MEMREVFFLFDMRHERRDGSGSMAHESCMVGSVQDNIHVNLFKRVVDYVGKLGRPRYLYSIHAQVLA